MAIKTCEQYVLDQLEQARAERAAAVAYDLEIIGHDIPCTGGAR